VPIFCFAPGNRSVATRFKKSDLRYSPGPNSVKRRGSAHLVVPIALALGVVMAGGAGADEPASSPPNAPTAFDLRSIAGGPGSGPATSIAQSPTDLTSFGSTLYIHDGSVIRALDVATGQERPWLGDHLPVPTVEQTGPAGLLQPDEGLPGPGRDAAPAPDLHALGVLADGTLVSGRANTNELYEVDRNDQAHAISCCSQYQRFLTPDKAGAFYYFDTSENHIMRKAAGQPAVAVAGGGYRYADTCPVGAALSTPLPLDMSFAFDRANRLFIGFRNCVVRLDSATGQLVRVAGRDQGIGSTGDGGPAVSAHLHEVFAITFDGSDDLFIATGREVRKVSVTGIISTVAGNGRILPNSTPAPPGDRYGQLPFSSAAIGDGGRADHAYLSAVGLAVINDTLYITDDTDERVRAVHPLSPAGVITTVAGNGWAGSGCCLGPSGIGSDGRPALTSQLDPTAMATAPDGTRVVSESQHDLVREIAPNGLIKTLAGTGLNGFSGDGGPATAAKLASPAGVVLDQDDNVYFADQLGARIRRIDHSTGTIESVVGGGTDLSDGALGTDSPAATQALAIDGTGNIYFEAFNSDSGDLLIRRLEPSSGQVYTVWTYPGFAPSLGLAFDDQGRLLVVNSYDVRAITAPGTPLATETTIAGTGNYAPHLACSGPQTGSLATSVAFPPITSAIGAPGGGVYVATGSGVFLVDAVGIVTALVPGACPPGAPTDHAGTDRAHASPSAKLLRDYDGTLVLLDPEQGRIYRLTPDHAPLPPTQVKAGARSGGALVSWVAPDVPPEDSPVRTFTVTAEPGHHVVQTWGSSTQAVVRGLSNDQPYDVTVTAANSAGTSLPSVPTTVTPVADPPGAVRDVRAQPIASGATVRWLPPLSTGGDTVTGYRLTATPGGPSETVPGNVSEATLSGLSPGRSVQVAVQALNKKGAGPALASPQIVPQQGPNFSVVVPATASAISVYPSVVVRDVDLGDVSLQSTSGAEVPLRLACHLQQLSVDCTQDAISSFTATPTERLQRGQIYTLRLNPDGDSYPVTDLHANPVAPVVKSFRAGLSATSSVRGGATSPSADPGGSSADDIHVVTRQVLADTSTGTNSEMSPIANGTTRPFAVAGQGGVPVEGATAVLVQLTVEHPSSTVDVVAWSGRGSPPHAAGVVGSPARPLSSATFPVQLADDGTISVHVSGGSTDIRLVTEAWYGGRAPSGFHVRSMTPQPVLDATVTPSNPVTLHVQNSGLIPTPGASAAFFQITASATTDGALTLSPADRATNQDPDLVLAAHSNSAGASFVELGQAAEAGEAPDEAITITTTATSARVRLSLTGWTGSAASTISGDGESAALTPARSLDTRNGTNVTAGRLTAGAPRTWQVAGALGVPDRGVSSVTVLVSASRSTASASIRVWAAGADAPTDPTIIVAPGSVGVSAVQTPLGRDGQLEVSVDSGSVDAEADVVSYTTAVGFLVPFARSGQQTGATGPEVGNSILGNPLASPDGRDVYVSELSHPLIRDIDTETGAVLASIPLSAPASRLSWEPGKTLIDAIEPNAAFSADGRQAWTRIEIVSVASKKVVGIVPLLQGDQTREEVKLADGTRLFEPGYNRLMPSDDGTTAAGPAATLAKGNGVWSPTDWAFLPDQLTGNLDIVPVTALNGAGDVMLTWDQPGPIDAHLWFIQLPANGPHQGETVDLQQYTSSCFDVSLDSAGDLGYSIRNNGLDVYDVFNTQLRQTLSMPDTCNRGGASLGKMVTLPDATTVAVSTDHGLALVPTSS
jgi:hypothetical protein